MLKISIYMKPQEEKKFEVGFINYIVLEFKKWIYIYICIRPKLWQSP